MADTGEGADAAVRTARELRVVVGRLRRRLRELHDTSELTPSQASVLSRLGKERDASASHLSALEGVRPQSMATTLAALEERGLVQRRPDPADGRRQLVSLTTAGEERYQGDRQAREEWLARELRDRYTEAERHTIDEALVLLDRLLMP